MGRRSMGNAEFCKNPYIAQTLSSTDEGTVGGRCGPDELEVSVVNVVVLMFLFDTHRKQKQTHALQAYPMYCSTTTI